MNQLPLCAGGCGKYPYVEQWHLWYGKYCQDCWQSHISYLERMRQIEEDHQRRIEQERNSDRRTNLFLFTVFACLIIALFAKIVYSD